MKDAIIPYLLFCHQKHCVNIELFVVLAVTPAYMRGWGRYRFSHNQTGVSKNGIRMVCYACM